MNLDFVFHILSENHRFKMIPNMIGFEHSKSTDYVSQNPIVFLIFSCLQSTLSLK